MVDNVKPGDKVKASVINEVISLAEKAEQRLVPKRRSVVLYTPKNIFVKNTTDTMFGACEPFEITGLVFDTHDQEKALKQFLTSGAYVLGTRVSSNTPAHKIGLTKERVVPGQMGQCNVPDLVGAKIYWSDPSHETFVYGGTTKRLASVANSENPLFRIVCGTRNEETHEGFGLLVPYALTVEEINTADLFGLYAKLSDGSTAFIKIMRAAKDTFGNNWISIFPLTGGREALITKATVTINLKDNVSVYPPAQWSYITRSVEVDSNGDIQLECISPSVRSSIITQDDDNDM